MSLLLTCFTVKRAVLFYCGFSSPHLTLGVYSGVIYLDRDRLN